MSREKARWQPVNIVLGIVTFGLVLCFCRPAYWMEAPSLVYARLVAAIVLILTRRNNLLSFIGLLLIGLTTIPFPSIDGFLILFSAVYMLSSAVFRMFGVKWHVAKGLAIALILGFGLFWDSANAFVHERHLTIRKGLDEAAGIVLMSSTGQALTEYHFNEMISPEGKGLQPGAAYAYRVIAKSGAVSIPLDKWPVFRVRRNGAVVRRGIVLEWMNLKDIALRGTFARDLSLSDNR